MPRPARWVIAVAVVLGLGLWMPATARAGQLGDLVSPGPLSRAHQGLAGAGTCQQCHELGNRVTPAKCLSCHAPIAARMTARTGVHRNARECVACHVEHAGAEADLRHFNPKTFKHDVETRFPLDGQHARVAGTCTACHKTRSYLQLQTTCQSCHADPHKGALGAGCATCHDAAVPFKAARQRFDHTRAAFNLEGAHQRVTCEKCHKTPQMKGVVFTTCASCHTDPHAKKFGGACSSCHTSPASWDTRRVEHARTRFPLKGAHQQVACERCHQSGNMTEPLKSDRCSSCHADTHRGAFKDDCATCHTERTFSGAPFEHEARTRYPLDGRHAGVACVKCHREAAPSSLPLAKRTVTFTGASRDCVSCHGPTDPHKGAFGRVCESCHQTSTFKAGTFRHPSHTEFFGGQHERVKCEQCHVRDATREPPREATRTASPYPALACVSCHADVHLGQVADRTCEACHTVGGLKFAAAGFVHDRSRFPLTGAHGPLKCEKCHATETRAFPRAHGTAMVLQPPGAGACASCHKDPHLGQVSQQCETCHGTVRFELPAYRHPGLEDFFAGTHGRYKCVDCHKKETGTFPAGRGTTVRFLVGRACASCHRNF